MGSSNTLLFILATLFSDSLETSLMGFRAVMVMWVLMAASVGSAIRELKDDGCNEGAPLFIFGASYMDVGENRAAMPFRSFSEFLPYGMDFPSGPSGRMSNGRLIIDHISELMGYGHIDPFLKTVGADFRHGVNFASSGSKACNSSITGDGSDNNGLFALSVQVDQFRVFRHQTLSLYQKSKRYGGGYGLLPSPRAFANGVYIIEAGNNDFATATHDTYVATSELVISNIVNAIRVLYKEGARTFMVLEVFPAECYPVELYRTTKEELNEDGCRTEKANEHNYHNAQLAKVVAALGVELADTNIVVFHLSAMIMDGVRNPSKYGLKTIKRACCGDGGGLYNDNGIVGCGQEGLVDGEWHKYSVCENRSEYMMWDHIHTTDAFNFHIAQAFVRGEFTTPSFSVKKMCQRQKQ